MRASVACVRCDSYDQDRVDGAVRRGISLLGGIGSFVKTGERLLLKPNALWASDPMRCIVTHPAIFRSAARLVQETGATATYGDSPFGVLPAGLAMRQCGFAAVAQELGIEQADFDRGQAVSHPAGLLCKQLMIARGVLSADGVISLPKLKTHGLTILTGAIKNQYGCVPGLVKGEYHARFPDVYDFSRLLADITACICPRLYVVDAVWAMEGNGPHSGDPKKLGCLLFSSDPVALEVVCCRLVNVDPGIVPTIAAGKRAGLGTDSLSDIEQLGDPLEELVDRTFKTRRTPPIPMPRSPLLIWLRGFFSMRPRIWKKSCTRCGSCIKACPLDPKAVNWKRGAAGRAAAPRYDYRRCIRCFCCQEMCPSGAITVHTPLARRLFPFATYLGLLASHVNDWIHPSPKR